MMSSTGTVVGAPFPSYPQTAMSATASRWLEVMPHLDPRYGGISTVVPELASQLEFTRQFSVEVAAFCESDESDARLTSSSLRFTRWSNSRAAWLGSFDLRSRFRSLIASVDAVHIHGLWDASSVVAARTASSLNRPYVLSAHGMLEPWALANKSLKKRIYSALVERANIEGAACLHALTRAEAADYRRFGSTKPIAIIPNGVETPCSTSSNLFLSAFPQLCEKRIILFLGRVHPKKGLDLLFKAWSQLASEHPGVMLVIAGPESDTFRFVLESNASYSSVRDQTFFTGMLERDMKWSALAAATAFVLPSYSEGFSVAILEAMSLAIPVIVTTACHLPEVLEFGAGWQIRPQALELYAALQDVLNNTPAENAAIGRRGKRLVDERFSWTAVSKQMADLYRWILGGPRPHSFELLEGRQ